MAVTLVFAVIVNVHVVVLLTQPPVKPLNTDPAAGLAVSVIEVPSLKFAEHVGAQLIPAGADVTVPLPVPAKATVSVRWIGVKVAVTLLADVMLASTHVAPEQSPLKLPKV